MKNILGWLFAVALTTLLIISAYGYFEKLLVKNVERSLAPITKRR